MFVDILGIVHGAPLASRQLRGGWVDWQTEEHTLDSGIHQPLLWGLPMPLFALLDSKRVCYS